MGKPLEVFLRIEFYILLFVFIFSLYLLNMSFWQSDKEAFSFFAMHYKENWFSFQDSHIGGMTYLNTYPPLVFQIMALLSYVVSLNLSYQLVILAFWILLAFFSTKFFFAYIDGEKKYKKYFWIIFLFNYFALGMFRASVIEGWITTFVGLSFTFISLYYFILFLKGKIKSKILFILPFLLTAATNTFSFVFLLGVYSFIFIFDYKIVLKKTKLIFITLFFLFEVVYFLIIYSLLNSYLQGYVETVMGSRNPLLSENFVEWFYSHFGISLVALIIFPLYKPLKKAWKLYVLAIIFFIIGLGRTTPLTKIVFGELEIWLMYDQFLFFSSIFFTLFLSFFLVNFIYGKFKSFNAKIFISSLFIIYLIYNLSEAFIINPFALYKDPAIDQSKNFVLDFLNFQQPEYRYQTFGYPWKRGDFYLNTKMHTLDTDYTSFKTIDILKKTGVRHINDIKNPNLISQFFNIASNCSVKYVITFNGFYENITNEQNWKVVANEKFGEYNVIIWENPMEVNPIKSIPEKITIVNYLWGSMPLITLFAFIFILFKKYKNK